MGAPVRAGCRVFLSVSSHFLFIKSVEKKLPLSQFLSNIAKLVFGGLRRSIVSEQILSCSFILSEKSQLKSK